MRRLIICTAAAAALAAPAAASAAEFEGTVVSVSKATDSFRLSDSERGTKRIYVRSSTRFERISGLGGLKAGDTNIEVVARRVDGKLVASEVERSGGGGQHGGGGGGGSDDD